MNRKKRHSILIAGMMLLSVALAFGPTVNAGIDAYTIKGILYLDDGVDIVPAGAGIQIDLEFNDGTEITTTFVQGSQGGINNYYFGFSNEHDEPEDQPGNFIVNYLGHALIPTDNPTVTIIKTQIWYYINLTVDISNLDEYPSKVTGLTVTDAKDGKLNLDWNAATDDNGVDHYNIYRDSAFLISTGTSYQDTGLTNGQSYTYEVSAVDTIGQEGENSNPVSGTPTASGGSGDNGGNGGNGDSGGNGGGGTTTLSNPVADAGGDDDDKYYGVVGEVITFDGSGSSDSDGDIVSYEWDFDNNGDYDDGTGLNPTYSWSTAGQYTIKLKVTDNDGRTGTDEATVMISLLNNLPYNLVTAGITDGSINTTYNYTATAEDDDVDDTIKYGWDWDNDDVVDEWTEFNTPDETVTVSHTFTTAGLYIVKTQAEDNYAGNSGWSDKLLVFIDVDYYLGDDGKYYIDIDKDGTPDQVYDSESGTPTDYEPEDTEPATTDGNGTLQEQDNTIWYIFGIIIVLFFIGAIFFGAKNKEKPNKKPKK